jgi:hypothetical protein
MTPEGIVKAKVKRLLKKYVDQGNLWYDMPVPSGFGKSTLDFIGHHMGRAFAIETKAEGKQPTKLQWQQLQAFSRAGGKVFVIVGAFSPEFERLEEWLA